MINKIIKTLGHWRWVFTHVFIPVQLAKIRYRRTLKRVRNKASSGNVLKVVFLVNEISKWKAQSLYEWMIRDKRFAPSVALYLTDEYVAQLSQQEQRERYSLAHEFFDKRGIPVTELYVPEGKIYHTLEELGADIIFYFQPWGLPIQYMPYEAAKHSLTGYIPYYVPNYGKIEMDCKGPLHRTLWAFFALNDDWANLYRNAVYSWMTSSRILGLGHTMLDVFSVQESSPNTPSVIYAPHWSLDAPENENCENYGTFLLNGKEILEFAQKHPEFTWIFKPHPDLRKVLQKIGWKSDDVEEYYDSWAKIGVKCENGDYPSLFMNSSLMITDCGSFLIEYACTGHPILHLISPTCKVEPLQQSKQLFDLYYQARSVEELHALLEMLLIRKEDPKKQERLAMVRKMQLCDNNAAEKIGTWLAKELFE